MKHLWVLLVVASLAACGGSAASPQKEPAVPAAQEEHEDEEPGVHVAADVQQQWGISVSPAEKTAVGAAVTLPGVLTLNQDRPPVYVQIPNGYKSAIKGGVRD